MKLYMYLLFVTHITFASQTCFGMFPFCATTTNTLDQQNGHDAHIPTRNNSKEFVTIALHDEPQKHVNTQSISEGKKQLLEQNLYGSMIHNLQQRCLLVCCLLNCCKNSQDETTDSVN